MAEAPASIVRITSLRAVPGERAGLVAAAHENASAARAAEGCRSAEVCEDSSDPQALVVISRWESEAALQGFLAWHRGIAHASLADYAAAAPVERHFAVVS
ncbi:hypothetical protein ET475_11225 [Microbacterium protaetiae]|uniref:ABM domain-containing protein n=1 Tax=Microbacterium protaetiae TaxID=2509458 RepID=A0A4P6EGD8_9MICO|nr:antibiotic biosynthesis monooxygenase family protein [Microbacterium protaetiae]QAY60503.1 hypothetical protein ET475_11225 [Microbacterium protaetiae]